MIIETKPNEHSISTIEIRAQTLKIAEEVVARLFPVEQNPGPFRVVADPNVPINLAALMVDGKFAAMIDLAPEVGP